MIARRRHLFQFPSNGKVYHKTARLCFLLAETGGFQFPSNGKVYHKLSLTLFTFVFMSVLVSIPFKREGVSQDENEKPSVDTGPVSIPFKREGVSQVKSIYNQINQPYRSFNSLQTGRCITRSTYGFYPVGYDIVFQFPSNGKVYHKRPHFKPSGAVASKAQNQTRSAHAYFYVKIFPKNPTNPHKH